MTEAKKTTKKVAAKEVKAESKTVKKSTAKKAESAKIKEQEVVDGNSKENTDKAIQADDQGQDELQAVNTEQSKDGSDEVVIEQDSKTLAKAGKRSAKSVKETEEKQAKEERKSQTKEEAEEPKKAKMAQKPARSRLERRGKNYRKLAEKIDKSKSYSLKEALDLAVKTSPVKFDAAVEIHLNLNVDPRQADQNIRGTVSLPEGTGKTVRVAVFGEADDVAVAKKAGADIAQGDELLQQLDKGVIDFDILIASPKVMAKLGKYAKVLGPKGLMPNPKSGTVSADVAKAVKEAKAGRVEYRVDSTGIIHNSVGKVSFGSDKLVKNSEALVASIKGAKPASIKGVYIKSGFVTTSMGPSIKVSL
jgi:large subunit ribosomal protein L1